MTADLRGLGLYRMPCGILTTSKRRRRHNWIVVFRVSGVKQESEYGEAYDRAVASAQRKSERGEWCELRLKLQ